MTNLTPEYDPDSDGSIQSGVIGDFDEAAQDAVGPAVSGGGNISVDYDDANNVIQISFTGSGGTTLAAPNGTSDNISALDPEAWLQEGYIVGQTPGYYTVIDPREHTDDTDALQTANDTVLSNMDTDSNHGLLRLPAIRPDGTRYSFPSTVNLMNSGASSIALQGYNQSNTSRNAIECTIDDGSPLFHFNSNGGFRSVYQTIGGISCRMNGRAEFFRFTDVSPKGGLLKCQVSDVYGTDVGAEGVFVFEGGCFNFQVDMLHANGFSGATASDCLPVFAFTRSTGGTDETPGEIVLGENVNSFTDTGGMVWTEPISDADVTNNPGLVMSNIMFHGRAEGAISTGATPGFNTGAAIHVSSGAQVYINSGSEIGNNDKGGSPRYGIYHNGEYLGVSNNVDLGQAPSGGLFIPDRANVSPSGSHVASIGHGLRYFGSGPIIKVDEDDMSSEAGPITLPDRNDLVTSQSVSYPSGTNGVRERTSTEL